ncbi:hypothetical protein GCM10023219_02340 [Stakelama sediminis]|uniref:diguanylate cyclase n=1 Tax=Stakelama sediminis TaxID=463200 RepID=A0A840Z0R9_9SPHN|nr:GGDEF domain-containing protein [Stakelama sediminis]MBB5719324.1 diguanylate cyclase (GGDEF)-like protein [Stakelama sediminis]
MAFYRATQFLFPRHYEWRILAICFGAVHVPLIAFAGLEAVRGHWDWISVTVLLIATLAGTAAGLWALSALLAPIDGATKMLRCIQRGQPVATVPAGGDDVIGRLLSGVAVAADENAGRIDQLIEAAGRDMLTGLHNRRGFMDQVAGLLSDDGDAVLAMIDLDRFKQVNDRFGHDRGDKLLLDFSRHLSGSVRRSDVVARWGGEEFVVLFPDTALETARDIMDRIRVAMAARQEAAIDGHVVTFSSGLAPVRGYARLAEARHRADEALYRAKKQGRNRISVAAA